MTIHYIHVFEPTRGHELGSAMRHGDHSDVARERAKTYTETDPGGGDHWRSMLLAQATPEPCLICVRPMRGGSRGVINLYTEACSGGHTLYRPAPMRVICRRTV